jgi:hypothetical protein
MLREARYYSRLARGVHRFLRTSPAADPAALVREQLEQREARFLSTVREVIFANPRNPYRRLFHAAGCTFHDLEATVRSDGLEPTLDALYRSGVYLTHDEFKGKQPVRRGNLEMPVTADDFANPLVRGGLETCTSGSRSAGVKTSRSVPFLIYREALDRLWMDRLGLAGRPQMGLYHSLPAMSGVYRAIVAARHAVPMERWFTVAGEGLERRAYQLMTGLLIREARLLGVPACRPTYLQPNDFGPVAEWLARQRERGVRCVVSGGVSRSVRVAAAASERGLNIEGTAFVASGEAMTRAKRVVIEATGSEAFSLYVVMEIGPVGISCRNLRDDNGVHVFRDSVAVISRRRQAPLSGTTVDSLLLTTLLPVAPLVLINVEMDDCGTLESLPCDCGLAGFGYHQRIRGLYSYGKLTAQGATLVGTDLLRILEEDLPVRFGGTPTDYQLVEYEGARQTEMQLRVHPRLAIGSEQLVQDYFLGQVRLLWGGSLMRREWMYTQAVRVVFAEPIAGRSGKVLALHLLREGTPGQPRQAR